MHHQACWNASPHATYRHRVLPPGASLNPSNKPGRVALVRGIVPLRTLAAFIATHLDAELVEKGNATAVHFRFLPKCLADLASIARDDPTMRTVAVIFALALITIAFEIYSDVVLTRSEFSRPAPDPATTAFAHALTRG